MPTVCLAKPCQYSVEGQDEKTAQMALEQTPPLLKLLYEAEDAKEAENDDLYKRKIAAARHFILSGADLTVWDKRKCSALLIAAQNGEMDIVASILLAASIIPGTKDNANFLKKLRGGLAVMPSAVAFFNGHEEVSKSIRRAEEQVFQPKLEHEIVIFNDSLKNAKTSADCKQILDSIPRSILEGGRLDHVMVESNKNHFNLYIEKLRDINAVGASGLTLLSTAVILKQKDKVRILLDKGADPNLDPISMRRPLMASVIENHLSISELLLERGAKTDFIDDGTTPLTEAILNKDLAHVRLLLKYKADANFPLSSPPILDAAQMKKPQILRALLDAGAIPNVKDDQKTPLYIAAETGDLESVKVLLEPKYKARVIVEDRSELHPIDAAVELGNREILTALLEAGALVDDYDDEGRSVVHDIASKFPKLIKLFLNKKYSVNLEAKDHKGLTPRDILLENIKAGKNVKDNRVILDLLDKEIEERKVEEVASGIVEKSATVETKVLNAIKPRTIEDIRKDLVGHIASLKSQGYGMDSAGIKFLKEQFETIVEVFRPTSFSREHEEKQDSTQESKDAIYIQTYLATVNEYFGKDHPLLKLEFINSIEDKARDLNLRPKVYELFNTIFRDIESELLGESGLNDSADLERFHRFSLRLIDRLRKNKGDHLARDSDLLIKISKAFEQGNPTIQDAVYKQSLINSEDFYDLYEKSKKKELGDLFLRHFREVLSDHQNLPAPLLSKVFRFKLETCDLNKSRAKREKDLASVLELWDKSEKSEKDREAFNKCYGGYGLVLPGTDPNSYRFETMSKLLQCEKSIETLKAEKCVQEADCRAHLKQIEALQRKCEQDAKEIRELRAMLKERVPSPSSPGTVSSPCESSNNDQCTSPLASSPRSLTRSLVRLEEKKARPAPVFTERKVWIHRSVTRQIKGLSAIKKESFDSLVRALQRKGTDFTEFCKDPEKFTQVTGKLTLLHCHLKGIRPITVVAWCEDAGEIQIVKVADHPDGNDYSEWIKDLPGKCLAKDKLSLMTDSHGDSDA